MCILPQPLQALTPSTNTAGAPPYAFSPCSSIRRPARIDRVAGVANPTSAESRAWKLIIHRLEAATTSLSTGITTVNCSVTL